MECLLEIDPLHQHLDNVIFLDLNWNLKLYISYIIAAYISKFVLQKIIKPTVHYISINQCEGTFSKDSL